VFAVSDQVAESMKGSMGWKAVTLQHGIDVRGVASAAADRDEVRAELGIGADEIVIGTAANFRPQKDYPNLLAAARLLVDRGLPVRFVAVGQGPQEAEVRRRRAELDLEEHVILTGFRADAVRVLGACDVFTLASQWEGLPVALMEALALGLPVVATAVGGVAEEMHDGNDALLVPPRNATALADALERVVCDAELRQQLGRAARQRAEEFDVGRAVQVLEEAYARGRTTDGDADHGDEPGPEQSPSAALPRPPKSAGLDIRAATPDDRPAILDVLSRTLGAAGDDPRYQALFAWKHEENPFGPSPMWVATDTGRVVAFRTFMRWEFLRGARVLRVVRAVDTATDPDYQGRGLFTALTLAALDELRADGIDFVFNTPNEQSLPGYLKMGWREVGPLPAALRVQGPSGAAKVVRSRVPAERWSQELAVGEAFAEWLERTGDPLARATSPTDVRELHTRLSEQFLAWRFCTPLLAYRAVHDADEATTAVVRARRRGAALELALVGGWGRPRALDRLAACTARQAGCHYVMRLGSADPLTGYLPVPGGGPMLTWRAVNEAALPPRSNWRLTLGDIELF
jgi:GNAT superfamily N-acetyltransferase